MKLQKILPFILLISLLSACSSEKEKKTVSQEEVLRNRIKGLLYEVLSESKIPGVQIKDLYIDTTNLQNDIKGLIVTFNVEVSQNALDSLLPKGYNAYFIDVKCSADGKTYTNRGELFKSNDKKKFINKNRDCFISQSANRRMEIAFPYRLMEFNEGEKEVMVDVEAFPAKFEDDTSGLHMKHLEGICPRADGGLTMKLKVKAPRLYKAAITVHKTKINTQVLNPGKFDVGVLGKGYPDLFWEVYLGNDYVYYSPVIKNKIEYDKKYTSTSFYCTADDVIHLALVDYDNGPFNTQDDIVDKWSCRINKIQSNKVDTLKFGNLEYLIVETSIE